MVSRELLTAVAPGPLRERMAAVLSGATLTGKPTREWARSAAAEAAEKSEWRSAAEAADIRKTKSSTYSAWGAMKVWTGSTCGVGKRGAWGEKETGAGHVRLESRCITWIRKACMT
eukprot:8170430-Prorocentrum_lima.AAC.1